jgi:sugar diacid utilization regulator
VPETQAGDDPLSPTLDQLVDILGPAVLQVLTSIAPATVPVRDIVIYDPADPPLLQAADLLLGVGLQPTSPDFPAVLRDAAAAGAAAVVVKPRDAESPALRCAVDGAGVTVLSVPAGMRWGQLAALLRHGLDAAGLSAGSTVDVTDLFALANVVARMVGGPVTIEDAQNRVLAYSNAADQDVDVPRKQTILGRQVPEPYLGLLRERGVFRELYRSNGVVRVAADPSIGLRRRLAVTVRAGDQILGSLWAAEAGQPLRADAETALLDAARLAAVHLVRARSAGYEVWKQREELLRQLLEDRADARIVAESLAFDAERPAAVLGIALRTPGGPAADHGHYRQLGELLATRASAFRWRVAVTVAGTRMLALLPELSGEPDRLAVAIRRIGEGLASSAAEAGLLVHVAVGPVVPRLSETPSSRAVVDEVLRALAAEPQRGPVATVDDVRAAITLRAVVALLAARPELHPGPVVRLHEHDVKRGTDYLPTLRTWLDCFGDVAKAAQRLRVHPNTFRYRLRKLGQISGMDLEDPAQRSVAALHLLLAEQGSLVTSSADHLARGGQAGNDVLP